MVQFGNHLLDHLSGANVFNIFHTIGSAGGLYTLLAPYFVAFSQFTMGRDLGLQIAERFARPAQRRTPAADEAVHVAHFTDTFYEINGVALTLQQQVHLAISTNRHYTLITCDDQNRPPEKGVTHFKPIGTYELPEYEQQKIFYPPLLEMLDYCHQQGFNHIHTATPGPIGLAALAIARFLRLPISGTYHTAIPQYVQILTGSGFMEELAWKFVLWYYDQMDLIYALPRAPATSWWPRASVPRRSGSTRAVSTPSASIRPSATDFTLAGRQPIGRPNCFTWAGFPRKRTCICSPRPIAAWCEPAPAPPWRLWGRGPTWRRCNAKPSICLHFHRPARW